MTFTNEQVEMIEAFRSDGNVPGVSVALVKSGEIVASGGFGYRNIEDQLPMNAGTISPIASLTKSFTGMAVMMLVEEGKLALDEPVQTWLPEFRVADADASRKMTPRMFLSHKSGIGRTGHQNAMWSGPSPYHDRADLISRLQEVELQSQPNEAWSYCNEGYVTLGHLIELQSGMPLHEFLEQRVFARLGLTSTRTNFLPWKQAEDRTTGYIPTPDGLKTAWLPDNYDIYLTTGGIVSTVLDLARCQILAMDYANHPLLSAGSLEQTHTISMPYGDSGWGYGLGWMVAWHDGLKVVEHSGGLAGVATHSLMVPGEGAGAVVLTNLSGAKAGDLAEQLAGSLIGRPLFRKSTSEPLPLRSNAAQPDSGERSRYSGEYTFGTAKLTISDSGERLIAQPYTPEFPDEPSTGLIAVGTDRFLTLQGAGPVSFLTNDAGVPDRLLFGGNMYRRA